ncbi:MAG: hypothetical protein HY711_03000, partial [Candidatus Melainabacteria bacterium]|nr:hypothetical protein [Candidatus Melainabacteria bacterium]
MVKTNIEKWREVLPVRIQKLREAFMQVTPSISIERAVALTQEAKDNPGLPPVLLKAKGFYRACETISIDIGEDELIVGHPGGKSR